MLKKEFRKKDVNRMRNLITGKTGASSEIQMGYKKIKKTIKKEIFGQKIKKLGLLKMV